MNRLNIGFDCLLIFFNLFACHHSYAMASERCGHQTIFGHEIAADFFVSASDLLPKTIKRSDKLNENNSDVSSNQAMADDSNRERLSKLMKKWASANDLENKKEQATSFFIELIKKNHLIGKNLEKKKSFQEVNLELSTLSFSGS